MRQPLCRLCRALVAVARRAMRHAAQAGAFRDIEQRVAAQGARCPASDTRMMRGAAGLAGC